MKKFLALIFIAALSSSALHAVCSKYAEYSAKAAAAQAKLDEIQSSIKRIEQQLENGDVDIFTRRELMQDRAMRQAELDEIAQLRQKLERCIVHNID